MDESFGHCQTTCHISIQHVWWWPAKEELLPTRSIEMHFRQTDMTLILRGRTGQTGPSSPKKARCTTSTTASSTSKLAFGQEIDWRAQSDSRSASSIGAGSSKEHVVQTYQCRAHSLVSLIFTTAEFETWFFRNLAKHTFASGIVLEKRFTFTDIDKCTFDCMRDEEYYPPCDRCKKKHLDIDERKVPYAIESHIISTWFIARVNAL